MRNLSDKEYEDDSKRFRITNKLGITQFGDIWMNEVTEHKMWLESLERRLRYDYGLAHKSLIEEFEEECVERIKKHREQELNFYHKYLTCPKCNTRAAHSFYKSESYKSFKCGRCNHSWSVVIP